MVGFFGEKRNGFRGRVFSSLVQFVLLVCLIVLLYWLVFWLLLFCIYLCILVFFANTISNMIFVLFNSNTTGVTGNTWTAYFSGGYVFTSSPLLGSCSSMYILAVFCVPSFHTFFLGHCIAFTLFDLLFLTTWWTRRYII